MGAMVRRGRPSIWWLLVAATHLLAGVAASTLSQPASSAGTPSAGAGGRPALCKPFGRASVVAALEELKRGRMIVVTDDEDRENEGDLIMASEFATAETVGFIVRHSSGVICTPLPPARLDELELPPMVAANEDPKETAFTVSVDLKGAQMTTGISAADRAATFRALADPTTRASDLQRPGHVFPLRPKAGGVLQRDGHTEATMDLMRLAGLRPCGILCEVCESSLAHFSPYVTTACLLSIYHRLCFLLLCEVVNDDGTMARVDDLIPFCEKHGLVLTSIADLIEYIKEGGH